MEPQEPSLMVRLFIFSGRPDPEWTLDGPEKDLLLANVRAARSKEPANAPPPGGLGYRGFLVRPSRITTFDLPEFRVFRGVLTFGAGRRAEYWRDINGVEEMLLAQARNRGFSEALEVFGAGKIGRTQGPTPHQP